MRGESTPIPPSASTRYILPIINNCDSLQNSVYSPKESNLAEKWLKMTTEDIIKSIKAGLYERVTSPLIGTFIISWCLWNYKFIVILLVSSDIEKKLGFLKSYMHPYNLWYWDYLYIFFPPLLATALFIFAYPYPAKIVYGFWHRRKKELHDKKQEIDKKKLLTEEESNELRMKHAELENNYAKQLKSNDDEIKNLNNRIHLLEEELKKHEFDIRIKERDQQGDERKQQESERALDEEKEEVLKALADAPNSRILEGTLPKHIKQQHELIIKNTTTELHSSGYISKLPTTGGAYLSLTAKGIKYLVDNGLLA